jgi:hypothetical protein
MKKNVLIILSALLVISSLQSKAQEKDAMPQIENKALSVLIVIKSDAKTVEIDNRLENKVDLDDIDPNHITTISVLKDNEAIEQYGEKARDGVIVIHLRDYASLPDKTKKLFEKVEKKD